MIRPGDVYGPGSVPWTLRPLEMARAGQLAVPGRGDGLMLPLYIDDLAEAVVLALAGGRGRRGVHGLGRPRPGDLRGALQPAGAVRRRPRGAAAAAPGARAGGDGGGGMGEAARQAARLHAPRAVTFIDRRGTVSAAKARDQLGWEPQRLLRGGDAAHAGVAARRAPDLGSRRRAGLGARIMMLAPWRPRTQLAAPASARERGTTDRSVKPTAASGALRLAAASRRAGAGGVRGSRAGDGLRPAGGALAERRRHPHGVLGSDHGRRAAGDRGPRVPDRRDPPLPGPPRADPAALRRRARRPDCGPWSRWPSSRPACSCSGS